MLHCCIATTVVRYTSQQSVKKLIFMSQFSSKYWLLYEIKGIFGQNKSSEEFFLGIIVFFTLFFSVREHFSTSGYATLRLMYVCNAPLLMSTRTLPQPKSPMVHLTTSLHNDLTMMGWNVHKQYNGLLIHPACSSGTIRNFICIRKDT